MNIIKYELKANLRPFIFWSIGLFFLSFLGMTKYTGLEAGGADLNAISDQFPRVIVALLGMADVDTRTLSGFFAVISYYTTICASVYAVSMGFSAVSREAADKTYEFLFTKPRKRSYILSKKLEAGFIFITLYSVLNYLFSIASITILKFKEDIGLQVLLFCISVYIVSLVFFSLSAMVSTYAREAEKGAKLGNYVFVFAFVMGLICDMFEKPGLLRLLSPIRYFPPAELLSFRFSAEYTVLSFLIIALSLFLAFRMFKKKDLTAA